MNMFSKGSNFRNKIDQASHEFQKAVALAVSVVAFPTITQMAREKLLNLTISKQHVWINNLKDVLVNHTLNNVTMHRVLWESKKQLPEAVSIVTKVGNQIVAVPISNVTQHLSLPGFISLISLGLTNPVIQVVIMVTIVFVIINLSRKLFDILDYLMTESEEYSHRRRIRNALLQETIKRALIETDDLKNPGAILSPLNKQEYNSIDEYRRIEFLNKVNKVHKAVSDSMKYLKSDDLKGGNE